MSCGSGFVEDVTIREDSPSSQSDDQSWGGLEAAMADTFEVNQAILTCILHITIVFKIPFKAV